jgi:tricorn protease
VRAFCILIAVAGLMAVSTGPAPASPSMSREGYLDFPTINGNTIVFSCDNDLWSVPAEGGLAMRLTQAEGREYMPRFSPDGRMIAFTGDYDGGGNDVYVIPAAGGVPRRLTYHPYSDYVLAWTNDGKSIVFRSMRQSPHYTYKVFSISPDGGFPEALPLDEVSLMSFEPGGRRVAFNRFSREFRTWKRYTGGLAQDIWVGDPETLEFRQITDFEGTDAFPMWIGDRIYFVSDRDATMNIYSMNPQGGDVRQHTFHEEYDVRWPAAGRNKIVYQNGGDIWLLDTASGDYRKVSIQVPSDRIEERERFVEPDEYVTDFEVSPKGRRVAFCSRGDLALVPVEEGRTIVLTNTSGVREKFPRWSQDGKSLAYISDTGGEEEIYVVDVPGGEPEQITKGTGNWKYPPVWSPDGKKLAYSDGSQTLFLVDRETGRVSPVDSSEYWETTDYSWSPDSRWLAYSKYEDHIFQSIFIFDTKTSKITRITDRYTNDTEPVWDPEGKYLYFLSDRTINPVLSQIAFDAIIDKTTKPYLVVLEKGKKSPFFPKEPEELDAEENGKDEDSGGDKARDKKDETEETKDVKIDLAGIMDRVVEFPVDAGHYSQLAAAEGKVFYLSRPSMGMAEGQRRGSERRPMNSVHMFDMGEKEDEVILPGVNSYRLSPDGKKIIYRKMNEFYVVDAGKQAGGGEKDDESRVDLSAWNIRLDPRAEWEQMFNEAWRLQRDFYWAPDMAGIDWASVKAKYEKLLPRISTRDDLGDLIGEMIAELSTSHTYIWGGDMRRPDRIQVGLLGADIEPEGPGGYYRIKKIYPPEASSPDAMSPLMLSHAGVTEGEYIIAVNGQPAKLPVNFYSLFLDLAGDEVLLTVNDKPSTRGARDVIVKTVSDDGDLRYLDWVRSNREYVDRVSGGKIGYIHIPDMSTRGLIEFQRTFYPQLAKPGIIIDARYNGGGFVSELIIRRLSVNTLAYGKARKGRPYRYPDDAVDAYIVALCNQHAGSDGDIFPRAFKLSKLGPVIGMRTWGGVVGIRMDKPFVDGGLMTIPEFAWWEAKEGWTLENRGVQPDIEVENMPGDVLRGRDAQLDKAIEVVVEKLGQDPKQTPDLPPFPDKSKESYR